MTDYYTDGVELWEVIAQTHRPNAGAPHGDAGSILTETALRNARSGECRLAFAAELRAMRPVAPHATVKPELSQEVNT